MGKKRISILIVVVLIIIAFYGGRYAERRCFD